MQVGETEERTMNDTREMWETYKVPRWVAKRAKTIIGKPENGIIEVENNTITWGCACSWVSSFDPQDTSEKSWNKYIDSMWAGFIEEMNIIDRVIVN